MPKSLDQWKFANDYFRATVPIAEIKISNLPSINNNMNNVIYNYFAKKFGLVKSAKNADLDSKYKGYSNHKLKSCLKQLKHSEADIVEIRVVSHLLRSRLNTSRPKTSEGYDDEKIKMNFWGYVKTICKKSDTSLPSFDGLMCTNFFAKLFSPVNATKKFEILDWIPTLPIPNSPFDLSPPSYKQITKVVRRIKTSGSPCPLDQLSIIPFKWCPYLRSYLTEVFRNIWQSGEIPNEWKKACTVLIHKKGDQSDPANFRPITLESTPLKIFTSCLRDSMFAFLSVNLSVYHYVPDSLCLNYQVCMGTQHKSCI